jgi:hypothetical protein
MSLDELERMRALPKNWDGYGAPSINPEMISLAGFLIEKIRGWLPVLRVVPTSGGSVQIELICQGKLLELELCRDGIHCLKTDGFRADEEEWIMGWDRVEELRDAIHWLTSND